MEGGIVWRDCSSLGNSLAASEWPGKQKRLVTVNTDRQKMSQVLSSFIVPNRPLSSVTQTGQHLRHTSPTQHNHDNVGLEFLDKDNNSNISKLSQSTILNMASLLIGHKIGLEGLKADRGCRTGNINHCLVSPIIVNIPLAAWLSWPGDSRTAGRQERSAAAVGSRFPARFWIIPHSSFDYLDIIELFSVRSSHQEIYESGHCYVPISNCY